jgi:peroxiredoxin
MSSSTQLRQFGFVAFVISLAPCAPALAQGKHGDVAPDFPPGVFNDGNRYQLGDYKGKVVVLFFYEKDCPTCRGKIPDRNAVVKQYHGRPVKFFAVAAGDTLQQAKSYAGGTKLAMPVFADPLSLMEKRYGQTISLQNIWQFRVIGPDGKIAGYKMEPADIDKALAKVELKYNADDYHAKVRPAVELLEWNQYPAGVKLLRSLVKNKDKEVADSAAKLMEVVKADATKWMGEAQAAADAEPVRAYDLYSKVVATLGPADELAKPAAEALRTLKSNEAVKKELEARKMYDKVINVMAMATPKQKAEVAKFAADIARKYPDTPTGKKAEELQKELGA